jgi:hypothetical protein
MMGFFVENFPALAPLVVYRELGSPIATASFSRIHLLIIAPEYQKAHSVFKSYGD